MSDGQSNETTLSDGAAVQIDIAGKPGASTFPDPSSLTRQRDRSAVSSMLRRLL